MQSCDGAGLAIIHLEDQRDCSCIESQVSLARDILASRDIVSTDMNFASDITLWIHAAEKQVDGQAWGKYWLEWEYIEDSRQNRSLLHELLHHWEYRWLGVPYNETAAHKNWDEKGYHAVSNQFKGQSPTCP